MVTNGATGNLAGLCSGEISKKTSLDSEDCNLIGGTHSTSTKSTKGEDKRGAPSITTEATNEPEKGNTKMKSVLEGLPCVESMGMMKNFIPQRRQFNRKNAITRTARGRNVG
ncbi:hypothetical protein JTB14_009780 [Gonioctena quinquepunctata]|nr:hypothetical protein JTB14_009780 [Gonioctena quinquepunctata]